MITTVFDSSLQQFFTRDLDRGVHSLFTGDDESSNQAIDRNLALMQLALATIDAVQLVPSDHEGREKKARALFLAGVGASGPAVTAGAMFLLQKFALALVVGLGPLFIMCLIFERTRELFRRWLLYGVGTVFAMAMLSVVSKIALGISARVALAMWGSTAIMGGNAEGLSSYALQTAGLGLMMTILIVAVPPMAAMFFNGMLGSFIYYSAWDQNRKVDAMGRPAGAYPVGRAEGVDGIEKKDRSEMPVGAGLATHQPRPVSGLSDDVIKKV